MKNYSATAYALISLFAASANASAAPAQSTLEDRYVASRDAAIKKLKPIYDAGTMDDAGTRVEDSARADLEAQFRVILGPVAYTGYGPGKLNLGSLYEGDEGFGSLDGLRYDADVGANGQPAGRKDSEGHYVEPKAYIIVTTQTMFARWLRAHKDWWGKRSKNVPQQMGAALKDENFHTQAFSTGSAVVKFSDLPIAKPAAATFASAMLAGQTQDAIPDAADEVYVTAIANGKVYVANSTIEPAVRVAACDAIRAEFNKRAEDAYESYQRHEIDKKAFDKLGDLRQSGEDAFKRCFKERATQQPSFAEATKQAQAFLEKALGR